MHVSFFVFRRLLFILVLVYLPKYPLIQIIVFQALNITMVLIFLIIRPYKDDKVNIFSIINESTVVIIGFYLFFFLEEKSGSEFYAWLMIVIVVLMVAWNIVFILVMKLREVWKQLQERSRLNRLRKISEVEQKYLYFDYRKFFLSSLSQ